MAYNDLLHKTELAFEAALATVASAQSLTSIVGLDTVNQDRRSLTIVAEGAEPVYVGTANRQVTVAVSVRTNMDDFTPTQHREVCQEVFDVLFDGTLAATLSSGLSAFHCLEAHQLGEEQTAVGRSHVTTARFMCHCAPSDLT